MRLLPVAASIAIASIVGPRIVERIGTTAVVAGGLAIFAAGLGWASTASASTPYLEIAVQMVLLVRPGPDDGARHRVDHGLAVRRQGGRGLGRQRHTTRQLGGTLGVAIVGSVFASIYSGWLARCAGSPGAARRDPRCQWGESMAAAQQVIAQVPPAAAPAIRERRGKTAFLDGQWIGSLIAAGIALAAAVIVAGAAARTGTPNSLHRNRNRSTRRIRGGLRIKSSHRNTPWTDGHGTVEYFTRADGSRLRYFTAGAGPALVLMHTIRTQLDYFQRVIPLLWDSFTVYALDLPGMGWSDIVSGTHPTKSRTCAPRWSSSSPGY